VPRPPAAAKVEVYPPGDGTVVVALASPSGSQQ